MKNNKKDKRSSIDFGTALGQHLVVVLLKGLALLPFWALYALSDLICFLLINIVKYRGTVIEQNLRHAFPEKSDVEIRSLKNKFYSHLADVFLESVKLHSIRGKKLKKRVTFKGVDELNRFAEEGKGVIVLAYHHNNWEWGSLLQTEAQHHLLMVYNKMRNNLPMDAFLLHSRERWGGEAVQMGRAAKVAFDYAKRKQPALFWLVADQSALPDQGTWTTFLNREAAFFNGPEKIARKADQPVFFQTVKKIRRGYYEYEFSLLVEKPREAAPNEILLSYVRKMEEVIQKNPEYYLWSHKRWKHKRPDGVPLV